MTSFHQRFVKLRTRKPRGTREHLPCVRRCSLETGPSVVANMEELKLSMEQAEEIRALLVRLGEPAHVDLVRELGIVNPERYIKSLRRRTNVEVS